MAIQPTIMTDDEFIYTCWTMRTYGGGFAQHIGQAGHAADSYNKQRLMAAFPDLFEKFGPGSSFYMAYVAER